MTMISTTPQAANALALEMQAAAFHAWQDIHRTRGRAEEELIFCNLVTELDIVEQRDGKDFVDCERLALVADLELRYATFAAAQQAAGRHIDPETAEITFEWGQTNAPYGIDPELPEDHCVGRNYFARALGSDVWVSFCDLPDPMREALRARI